MAYAFAKEGVHLVLSSRNEHELERVKANCTGAASIFVYPMNIAHHAEIFNVGKKVSERYGSIDILVNNAGVSQRALAKDTDFEVDKRLVDVNLLGTIAVTKSVLGGMIMAQTGHIVTVSSLVGKFGSPLRSTYAATKHALHGFFDSLRAEVHKDGIQVTMVCPGFIHTNVSKNALTADGSAQNTMDNATGNGLSPDVAAQQIIRAIHARKLEVLIGGRETYAVMVKRYFPNIFARILRKAKVT